MAMIQCRECKKDVSSEAPTCPHCGVQNPAKAPAPQPTGKDKLAGLVVLCIAVAVGVYACSDSDAEKQAAADKITAEAAACKLDLQCLGDKASFIAAGPCARAIEKFSKNEAIWTDGTLDTKFPQFRWLDKNAAKVTLIGDKLQFTNGFGAKVNMRYLCHVDMSGDAPQVIDVVVNEGRW